MSKIRVALITDKFMHGGGLQQIYQIVTNLSGFSFGVFGEDGDATAKFQDLSEVQVFNDGYGIKTIRSFRPDIIHIHHLKPLLHLYKWPFMHNSAPVIFTLHGAHIHKYEFRSGFKNSVSFHLRFLLEKYLYNRVDHLIVVSQDDADFLREKYRIDNTHYIPNGLDVNRYSTQKNYSRDQLLQEFRIPSGKFIFLMAARFDFAKGHDILVKAVAGIKKNSQIQQGYFVLAGEGPEKERIRNLISELQVSQYFHFLPHSPVAKIMSLADALVLPSRWEAFPMIIPEAGFFRVPVIASRTYGIRRLIQHEQNGLLFENENISGLGQLIIQVLRKKFDLSLLTRNLKRDTEKRFRLDVSLEELEKTYRKIVQEAMMPRRADGT